MQIPTIFDSFQQTLSWIVWVSSQKWFSPVLNILTLLILATTAWQAFKTNRATSETNNLKLLPLLGIYFYYHRNSGKDAFVIKNLGEGVAYDIAITSWILIMQDTQEILEISMKTTGTNILAKDQDKNIIVKANVNGTETNIDSDMLHYYLRGFKATIQIQFKDATGRRCVTEIITTEHEVTIKMPTRRVGILRSIDIWYGLHIQRKFRIVFEKFLWRFEEKRPRDNVPSYIIRIFNIISKIIHSFI